MLDCDYKEHSPHSRESYVNPILVAPAFELQNGIQTALLAFFGKFF